MIEVIECEEFGLIAIGIDRLLVDGEIALDSRIVDKSYLNFSLVKGQVNRRDTQRQFVRRMKAIASNPFCPAALCCWPREEE